MLYHLFVNNQIKLQDDFKAEAVATIRSSVFNSKGGTTVFNFLSAGENILLHISIRPGENAIVFNSRTKGGAWGPEERVPYAGKFKGPNPSITVLDHGDRFQILFDNATAIYYTKRIKENAAAIAYSAENSLFSSPVTVDIHGLLPPLPPA
ncbi:galectin-1 [Coprinopsis cinerea okayama7|uniref:Galectin-1 n=2 Tax=Coprinopsis cinerea TaxID=5346 RepID=CGL1_COPC7|nr:galectin-1 [Coprinopsis cinerea okayama7\|eukprot:XP_001836010.2 galectin-1 [Coprinopsis cinerea okayama7\